jgi:hypothetical protein
LAALIVLLAAGIDVLRVRARSRFAAAPHRAMLAVLPFVNLSNDPEQEYFSDGLTEETITDLGELNPEQLGVIARTSSMAYKRTDKTIAQIGTELGSALGENLRCLGKSFGCSGKILLTAFNYAT